MSQHSAFLALPVELRTMIYEYLVDAHVQVGRKRSPRERRHLTSQSSLILVSHQIRDELYDVLVRYAFTTAEVITATIKNFNFKPIRNFLAACTDKQLALLRTSDPPRLVVHLRFCQPFREPVCDDWESTHLGRWLRYRHNQTAAERIPIRYEISTLKTAHYNQIRFELYIFNEDDYADQEHEDIADLDMVFAPFMALHHPSRAANALVDEANLCDTSASSESES